MPSVAGGRRGLKRFCLITLVTIAVFWFLFTRIDRGEVWRTLTSAEPFYLGASASLTFFFPVLAALRWRRMLLALGYRIPFRRCFDLIMAAWPMGTITPSKTGDLIKAWYLKDSAPVPIVLGSVLAERVLDVLVLLGLALAGCLAFGRWSLAALSGVALACALLAILLLLRVRLPLPARLQDKAELVLAAIRLLARSPCLATQIVLYTALNWSASTLQMVLAYRALGVEVPILFAAGALPLAIFVGLLPLSLSGMGTRDSAIIVLFAPFSPASVSLGVGILYSLFGYWLPSPVGLLFLKRALPREAPQCPLPSRTVG